ncbi:hypothetical protein AB0D35_07120 [Streptomyces sp. NPDC048301]|uniref:hypothetical protein n=1 Tax=unclassified Streptomyces TaxID=2593676 RepID=UPI0034261A14
MADEQQEWLDADVAERLLRGESAGFADPAGDHISKEVQRLESALRALRTPGPAAGELPGEAAVLAAFREAPREVRGSGRAVAEDGTGRQDALHTVRIGARPTAPVRRSRWTRPVRYGLAASIAGCALGGVAVAAGTGMLPAPFGGHGSPVPATSVSAAASPEELGVEVPDPVVPSPPPPVPSGSPGAPDSSEAPGPEGRGTAGGEAPTGGDDGTATDREAPGRDESPQDGPDSGAKPGEEAAAQAYKRSLDACRAYRSGTLSRGEERRLVALAGGRRKLDRFCDRLLGPDGRGGSDDGRNDGEDSGSDDGKTGGGDEGGLPSVTFSTPSRESSTDPARQGTAGPSPTAGGMSALSSVTR